MKTYVATYIEVQPAYTSQAIPLLVAYCTHTAVEEGNVRIEILQEFHRSNRFVVLEEWNDDASLQLHDAAKSTSDFRVQLRNFQKSPNDQRMHRGFAIGPQLETSSPSTVFVVTHVDVPPPRKDETEILLTKVAGQIRGRDSNSRFDVFQQIAPRLNHFTLVAAWADESAFTRHEANAEVRLFREELGPMLGALYDERLYRQIP